MSKYVPLLAAIVTAFVVLFGYIYDRDKEREFEINRTRQDIHTRLVSNLMRKFDQLEKLHGDKRMPAQVSSENASAVLELVATEYPELDSLFNEAREIMALLAIYGTDEAIEAVAEFYERGAESLQPGATARPDVGVLILELRRSLFSQTAITSQQINLILSK